MVSFVNFARIASLWVDFHLGTLHGYFFNQDFWPNLNFPLECQIKLILMSRFKKKSDLLRQKSHSLCMGVLLRYGQCVVFFAILWIH